MGNPHDCVPPSTRQSGSATQYTASGFPASGGPYSVVSIPDDDEHAKKKNEDASADTIAKDSKILFTKQSSSLAGEGS